MHLTLVGGTEFTGKRKPLVVRKRSAVAEDSREEARKAIRGIVLEKGKTVGQLIDEMNKYLLANAGKKLTQKKMGELLSRNAEIREALRAIGLSTIFAEPEMDLSVAVYGGIYNHDKLLKAVPALKHHQAALARLAF